MPRLLATELFTFFFSRFDYTQFRSQQETIMIEQCGRSLFRGKNLGVTGHCSLKEGHDGFPEACRSKTEADAEGESEALEFLGQALSAGLSGQSILEGMIGDEI